METETISKNEASLKSQMSRVNYVKLALLFTMFCIAFTSCKKNDDLDNIYEGLDAPPIELIEILDNQPTVDISLNDIILPDGQKVIDFLMEYAPDYLDTFPFPINYINTPKFRSSQQESDDEPYYLKSVLLCGMQLWAWAFCCNDESWAEMCNDGENPKQLFGLGYCFGNYKSDGTIGGKKEYWVRRPSVGCKDTKIYGLDCSGLVYHCAINTGLNVGCLQAYQQAETSYWKTALNQKGGNYSKIKVVSYNQSEMSVQNIQAGDIMYFKNGSNIGHIGIVVNLNGNIMLLQSNGDPKDCTGLCNANRGPRCIDLRDPIDKWHQYGSYGIIRLIVDDEKSQISTNECNKDDITETRAIVYGNIIKAGAPPYTEKGVCWSTHSNPTINDNKMVGNGSYGYLGSYPCTLTGLIQNTTYNAKAYVIQNNEPIYGNVINFTTKSENTILGVWNCRTSGLPSNANGYFTIKENGIVIAGTVGTGIGTWTINGNNINIRFGNSISYFALNGTINDNKTQVTGNVTDVWAYYNANMTLDHTETHYGTFVMDKNK